MSILKKCENCTIETGIEDYCYYCDDYKFSKHEFSDDKFIPKERLVRQEMLDKECKEAFYAGMQQAYFDIGTKIENDLKNEKFDVFYQPKVNVLNNIIPSPQLAYRYGTYRLNDINMNHNIFKTNENVKVNDLLVSLIDLCDTLIAYGDYDLGIPMYCLAE